MLYLLYAEYAYSTTQNNSSYAETYKTTKGDYWNPRKDQNEKKKTTI